MGLLFQGHAQMTLNKPLLYPFKPEEKFDLWSNSHWIL